MKKLISVEVTLVTPATWYKVGRIMDLIVEEKDAIVGNEGFGAFNYFTYKVLEVKGDYVAPQVDEAAYEANKARHIEASHKKGVE